MRLSKRKIISGIICAIVLAGTMFLALRLSYPPDPYPRIERLRGSKTPEVDIQTEEDVLRVRIGKEVHEYRLVRTKQGLAAEKIEDEKR